MRFKLGFEERRHYVANRLKVFAQPLTPLLSFAASDVNLLLKICEGTVSRLSGFGVPSCQDEYSRQQRVCRRIPSCGLDVLK
jgi:hypothetical protein